MLIKKGALKNSTNHTGEAPILKSPSTKQQALRSAALLKRDCYIGVPPPSPPSPPPPSPHRETRKASKNNPLYRPPPMMAASGERKNMI